MSFRISLTVLISMFLFTSSFGATLTVRQDGTGDHLTIDSALTAAGTGDIIDIGAGSYTEALIVTKSVTLAGSSMSGATILDGQNSLRPIEVNGPFEVTIRDFHIMNGFADNGSAVFIWNSPTVLVENCLFSNNHAYESNTLHLRHEGTHVTVRNCEFRDNTCDGKSAAIGAGFGGYLLLEDSIIKDNVAGLLCGAVNCASAAMDVRGCVFLRNSSSNTGAIVYSLGSGVVENNTFYENSGPMNGSIYAVSGVVVSFNIIVSDLSGPGLSADGAEHTGNLFYDNAGGPIVGDPFGPDELQTDPLFCDWQSEVFTLCSISPALAAVNGIGLIGAFDLGCLDCGVVPIEAESWGSIKSMFRDATR